MMRAFNFRDLNAFTPSKKLNTQIKILILAFKVQKCQNMQRINAIEIDIALSIWVSQDNFSMRNSEVYVQGKEFAGCFHASCSSFMSYLQFMSFSISFYNLHPCYVLGFLTLGNERIWFELNVLKFKNI